MVEKGKKPKKQKKQLKCRAGKVPGEETHLRCANWFLQQEEKFLITVSSF